MRNLFERDIPASKTGDPVTSDYAEEGITKSGIRGEQCQGVLKALKSFPAVTSAELADIMGVDRVMPARRLPDLEKVGKAKKVGKRWCTVTNRTCMMWEAT